MDRLDRILNQATQSLDRKIDDPVRIVINGNVTVHFGETKRPLRAPVDHQCAGCGGSLTDNGQCPYCKSESY